MEPQLGMHVSQVLIAFAQTLALSSCELDQAVERELAENPALVEGERRACACRRAGAGRCRRCWAGARGVVVRGAGAVERLPARPGAVDQLLTDVRLVLDPRDHAVATYLVGWIDERGLLERSLEEVALDLGVELARVQRVLAAVRDSGPPGVGAADVRECLLLQLDRLEDGAPERALARRVVADHLEALGQGRVATIAHALGVDPEDVVAARDFIRRRLSPYPSLNREPTGRAPIRPEVVVWEREGEPGEFDVEVVEAWRWSLSIDPVYRRCAGGTGPDARHAREAVSRAGAFLANLGERWATIRRVAECVVGRQTQFLRDGPGALVPLTRAEVARELGLHESTVSRAVAGKHLMLPSGRVAAFKDMFGVSLAPQQALREILAAERRPLSDAALAVELQRRGYRVARRTVTKYRDRLGVLPHHLRA